MLLMVKFNFQKKIEFWKSAIHYCELLSFLVFTDFYDGVRDDFKSSNLRYCTIKHVNI